MPLVSYSLKKDFFKKIIFLYNYFFYITLDPDQNWAKILDPDPNLMYLLFESTTLGATGILKG